MDAQNIITIVTSLAFGPAVAVVLLKFVLDRSKKQDQSMVLQAAEIATLQARVETLETEIRTTLQNRLSESRAAEDKLAVSVDSVARHAERLATVVTSLESRLANRTCQLPESILCRVRQMIAELDAAANAA